MGSWVLRINEVHPSGNVIKNMHWAVYHRLLIHWYQIIRGADGFIDIPKAKGRRKVTVIRYGKNDKLDRDNREYSAKIIFDVLRPMKRESGIYSLKARKAGQAWSRTWHGHGLILEDSDKYVVRDVRCERIGPGEKPYTLIILEDL